MTAVLSFKNRRRVGNDDEVLLRHSDVDTPTPVAKGAISFNPRGISPHLGIDSVGCCRNRNIGLADRRRRL
jgi:hypothetical protein